MSPWRPYPISLIQPSGFGMSWQQVKQGSRNVFPLSHVLQLSLVDQRKIQGQMVFPLPWSVSTTAQLKLPIVCNNTSVHCIPSYPHFSKRPKDKLTPSLLIVSHSQFETDVHFSRVYYGYLRLGDLNFHPFCVGTLCATDLLGSLVFFFLITPLKWTVGLQSFLVTPVWTQPYLLISCHWGCGVRQ